MSHHLGVETCLVASSKQGTAEAEAHHERGPWKLHGRTLWRAIQLVHAEGQQLTLSLVLAAVERLPEDPTPAALLTRW